MTDFITSFLGIMGAAILLGLAIWKLARMR